MNKKLRSLECLYFSGNLLLKYLRFRSSMNWSLSNLVAMLGYNLFTYRDLWLWLDNPFEVPAIVPGEHQLLLAFR